MVKTQNSSPLTSDAQQIKKQKSREKEYKRCRTVNEAFDTLQQKIPFLNPEERKQLPKIKTLRLAMKYITHLNKLLDGDAKYRISLQTTTVPKTCNRIEDFLSVLGTLFELRFILQEFYLFVNSFSFFPTKFFFSEILLLPKTVLQTTTLTNETRPLTHSDFRNTVTDEMRIRNSYRERAHSEEMDQETVQRILTRERSRRRGSCSWGSQERDFPPQNFPVATENLYQQANVFNGNYLRSTYNNPMVPSYSMPNSVENQDDGYYSSINYGYQYQSY
ncbi:hypothetical protein CAEBREN_06774 [Caenorhabditis brenneri]|uniref:BHLH domain-containing protein n=1 Tax=Caenorhabditis brenneri TaxID=135651 RepID=G0P2M0_CAEBE|nr:hypothetical protein CAEBREN_06774 [Caenorhabditis brenneri]